MAIKKIIRSSILFTLGNMLPLLASVILLFPYTDNLDTSLYGELAIYISFTLLLQVLFNYGIDSYVGIHYFDYRDDPQKLKQFIGTILTTVFTIGGALILFFIVTGNFLFHLIFKEQFSFFPYGFMSVLTAFCNAFFRIYVNFLFYKEKAKRYFFFNLFNFIITLVICIIGLYQFPHTLVGPLWGRLLSGVAIFLLAFYFFIKEFGFAWQPTLLKNFHSFCMPVAGFFLLTWVVLYINNYIINAFSTTSDVGIYDFALKCTMLIEVVQTGTLGTINIRIYNLWKRNTLQHSNKEENRYHHVFAMFNVLFIAFNIVCLPIAIKILVHNESYYEVFQFLPVLCASFVFRGMYNAYYNVVMFQKKTKALPRALFITSVIQIVLCIILVQQYGIWGAVWSYVIAKPIQAFLLWIESRNLFAFKYNFVKIFGLPLLFFAIVLFLEYFPLPINRQYLPWLEFTIAIILVLMVFRKDLKDVRLVIGK